MVYAIGAVGGLAACIGLLLSQADNVLESYFAYEAVRAYAFTGFGLRVALFCALGAFWVFLNPSTVPLTVFQLGMAAPFAIGALFSAVAEKEPPKTAVHIENGSGQVQAGEKTTSFGAFWTGLLGKPLPPSISEEVSSRVESGEQNGSVAEKIAGDIVEKFRGNLRKDYSDTLIALYESNHDARSAIVNGLFLALQSNGYYEYRINLYILRTLGMLQSWTPTAEQSTKLATLSSDPLSRDPTFRFWVDKAIASAASTGTGPPARIPNG